MAVKIAAALLAFVFVFADGGAATAGTSTCVHVSTVVDDTVCVPVG